jgi:hypothetical protein
MEYIAGELWESDRHGVESVEHNCKPALGRRLEVTAVVVEPSRPGYGQR